MKPRIFGALLVVVGCSAFGFSLAAVPRREERLLKDLLHSLLYMESELTYRLTPLPELFQQVASISGHTLGHFYMQLSEELDTLAACDATACMDSVLAVTTGLPASVRWILTQLGRSLGCFDLSGQLRGIAYAQETVRRELTHLQINMEHTVKSFRLLGCCAGAAIAILLL